MPSSSQRTTHRCAASRRVEPADGSCGSRTRFGDAVPWRFWHAWRCAIDGHQSGTARPDNEQPNSTGVACSAGRHLGLSSRATHVVVEESGHMVQFRGNHRSDKAPVARRAVGRRVNICSVSSLPALAPVTPFSDMLDGSAARGKGAGRRHTPLPGARLGSCLPTGRRANAIG